MHLLMFLLSIILTFFATTILAYISMATMIGPWIAPTLVLIAGFILKAKSTHQKNQLLVLVQTVGSVGGIVATAVGFTIPTLYFLDQPLFNNWLNSPLSFCIFIAIICISAGGLGIWLARTFANKMICKANLSFPVSQLIHKTITSQSQSKQLKSMLSGFFLTGFFCFLRDGFSFGKILQIKKLIPNKDIFFLSSIFGKELHVTLMPMYWAIGFIAGTSITMPLLIGMLSKYIILYPLNNHAYYLPFKLFPTLSISSFTMAFCSGLVLSEVISGFLNYPNIILNSIKSYSGYKYFHQFKSTKNFIQQLFEKINCPQKLFAKLLPNIEVILVLTITTILLSYYNFSLLTQIFMIILTIIATYQISYLGGQIGLVQFGRFATFVMIPTILLFKLDSFQIVLLCVFVGICSATATDLLFDYKVGQLCNITFQRIHRYQWLGLIITSLSLGLILWLLFTNLQLGTAELFAQRGKSRALLIQSINLNWVVVFFGFLYGLILKKLKISPTMAFGGILMPNGLTIGLVTGALASLLTKNRKDHFPFFSGIFSGESIWLIVSILTKII